MYQQYVLHILSYHKSFYLHWIERFWRISLYVIDDAIAKLYVTKSLVKKRVMVENLVT